MWLDLYHYSFEKGKNKPYHTMQHYECVTRLLFCSTTLLLGWFHPYQRQTRVVSICHWNECLMVMSSSALKQMASQLANYIAWHGIDS